MAETSCRHFNGYKPCGKNPVCDAGCPHRSVPASRVLIVHLGALGAVVRATCLLESIQRKYPNSHLTWVTDAPADQLLRSHPRLDRVLTTKPDDLLVLSVLSFDVAFVIDKSLKAAGVLRQTRAAQVFGFTAEPQGAIVPATPAAEELWHLGLDNEKKFFQNQKPETQLMIEALELGAYHNQEYDLPLTVAEAEEAARRHEAWKKNSRSGLVLGINTGCSAAIPYKKLSIEFHRDLVQTFHHRLPVSMVLLGGPEDAERNQRIADGMPVIQSPTQAGLRDGLVSVAACDLVLTGDSLGMHMAIALQKHVVAWFGPTCSHEIDLYGRGEKILSKASCGPCWKRLCQKETMCYDQVSLPEVLEALERGVNQCLLMSSSRQPSSGICSSASH